MKWKKQDKHYTDTSDNDENSSSMKSPLSVNSTPSTTIKQGFHILIFNQIIFYFAFQK